MLPIKDDLRLERPVTIPRDVDLHGCGFGEHSL
jgi:hypothetical protein